MNIIYVYANPFILNNNWYKGFQFIYVCFRSITLESRKIMTKPAREEIKQPRPYKYKMS